MIYLFCLISFVSGIILTILFTNFIYIKISIKGKQFKNIKTRTRQKQYINPKIKCIYSMLQEIQSSGSLPINLSGAVLMSLKEIGKTPNWEQKLDNETIDNLYIIYQRWQKHLKGTTEQTVKTKNAGGFDIIKYWEGTIEEYEKALEDGVIDDNTKVSIIEDTGEFVAMDEDGQIEEYME